MSRYRYEPLNSGVKTIRLMSLLPGSFEDDIRMSLKTVILDPTEDRVPGYEALSYTWGSPEPRMYVRIVADHVLRSVRTGLEDCLAVTRNLDEALRHLRLKDRARTLWIDAVCVDQTNLDERGSQVERMADIYRNARQVIIWIGLASDDSALAIETIRSLSLRIEVDWKIGEMKPSSPKDSDWVGRDIDLPYDEKTWISICHLLGRQWFKRLWIWQEVWLATSAKIHCGFETLGWETFRDAIFSIFMKPAPGSMSHGEAIEFRTLMSHLYNLVSQETRKIPLRDLLYNTRNCECTDPRDRVYALLQVHRDSQSLLNLRPNYKLKPREIFQDVVLCQLTNTGTLGLLTTCEWRGDEALSPTWVPEWSKPRLSNPVYGSRSCGGSKAKAEYLGDGVLKVVARTCAEIRKVETSIHLNKGAFIEDVIDAIGVWSKFVNPRGSCDPNSGFVETLCRTLCGNAFAESFGPNLSASSSFGMSLEYLQALVSDNARQIEPYYPYLQQMLAFIKGRSLFTTEEGYIGLASTTLRAGDQVSIVLGCNTPLILRSNLQGGYKVMGGCYIHGLMHGEEILGPLATEWQCLVIRNDSGNWFEGFYNHENEEQVYEDPRLGPLPPNWRLAKQGEKAGPYNWFVNDETGDELDFPIDPRMTAEALSARGVALEEILLV